MVAVILLLCLFAPGAFAEKYDALPQWQQMYQVDADREYLRDDVYIGCTYPHTANEQINQEMHQLIDEMAQRGRPFLPVKKTNLMPAYLDVGATIFRTGEKWMSFLTIAKVAAEREQIYVDFDARVYDVESGDQIQLTDLFAPESPAWEILSQAVREQLNAYFVTLDADPAALEALCTREAVEAAAFTLTPAKLSLHFRADQLYAGKHTMMHVHLYYPQIREYMTDFGREITDNSKYKMIALTYDDGGARGSSMNVLNVLRRYGANATFFIIGNKTHSNYDVICREHDAGYAVQSHNYEHVYSGFSSDDVQAWRKKFDRTLDGVIGQRPTYMRAPGGNHKKFVQGNVGLPLIHWSVMSGDADNKNVHAVVQRVLSARDGSVVLLHDLNPLAHEYSALFLKELQNRGFLFVTVDELFSHYGVELLPNTLYTGCEDVAAAQ